MKTEVRRSSFDSDWRFHLGDASNAEGVAHDDSEWCTLNVPHDFMIEQPRHKDNPSAGQGAYFPGNVAWYRKHFIAPKTWKNRQVTIEFEGVYHDAEFWLNEHYLGRHHYGYTSFSYNLNQHLKLGGDNVLSVRVDASSDPHTRWYSGSGIYRHVWLTITENVHVAHCGIYVTTPKVSRKKATVRVQAAVQNDTPRTADVKTRWSIAGPTGKRIAGARANVTIPTDAAGDLVGTVEIESPALWSPERPSLYELTTEIIVGNKVVDRVSTQFGIRWFSFTPEKGFVLNGKTVLMRGGNVHHDCGPLGATSIDRAEERKIELLKASGYNTVRCAHNPPSPAFLDACDRLGMLVMDEAFDVWRARKMAYDYHRYFDELWEGDLESMLYRDRNHPSIVIWSIGNELVERDYPEGAEIAKMLADHVRRIEPTRPVTAGICGVWGHDTKWSDTDDLFAQLDVCGYNYQLQTYKSDHKKHPERVVLATESFPPKMYEYWKAVENLPYVAGDFVWTSLDYMGEAGVGHTRLADDAADQFLPGWPWNQANCGDIDLCGWKRPQSYYRDVIWKRAKKPYIAVHPPIPRGKKVIVSAWGWHDVQQNWNWPVTEGHTLQVDVYFDCDEIQLLLNGRSLGRRPASARTKHIASFKVPYKPGELKAVAYKKGKVVAGATIATTGTAVGLRLRSDRTSIAASRNDLAYITIEAIDSRGRLVPDAVHTTHLTIKGPASIAAVASADPMNEESYRGSVHSLWRGRALAIVQPDGKPGVATIRAQADGLNGAETQIRLA